jgi:SAM-dependent methyltransferase
VVAANGQIGDGFDNRVFWELRYKRFPERGSGVGSHGDNLLYKRQLLKEHGVEAAASVLDFGCGDLEVVKELAIRRYVGIDQSSVALALARRARPDWEFRLAGEPGVQPAEMVLCFEVLIHQKTEAAYRAVIGFLAENTLGTLLVSGFAADSEAIRRNPMVFFHEPLETSLRRTGRFKHIQQVGAHTSVVVYLCEV